MTLPLISSSFKMKLKRKACLDIFRQVSFSKLWSVYLNRTSLLKALTWTSTREIFSGNTVITKVVIIIFLNKYLFSNFRLS